MLPKEGSVTLTFFLIKKPKYLKGYKTDVVFEVNANKKVISATETTFFSQPQ